MLVSGLIAWLLALLARVPLEHGVIFGYLGFLSDSLDTRSFSLLLSVVDNTGVGELVWGWFGIAGHHLQARWGFLGGISPPDSQPRLPD